MRYSIIYADPPWTYNDRRVIRKDGKMAKRGYGSANLYDIMSIEEIMALPIEDLAAENAALFMWVTSPLANHAERVMRSWGFRFIKMSGFVWVKTNSNGSPFFGVGFYTKSNSEFCALGVRGRMKPVSNSVSEVILAPHVRGDDGKIIHSRKPGIVREKIVELFGDLPRIELFSREQIPGWDRWGNEIKSNVEMPAVLPLVWR